MLCTLCTVYGILKELILYLYRIYVLKIPVRLNFLFDKLLVPMFYLSHLTLRFHILETPSVNSSIASENGKMKIKHLKEVGSYQSIKSLMLCPNAKHPVIL
jgi:hypothetical protein